MYMIYEEGEIITREVKGRPEIIEAIYLIQSNEDWGCFMRFMNRYAQKNDLGLSKSGR